MNIKRMIAIIAVALVLGASTVGIVYYVSEIKNDSKHIETVKGNGTTEITMYETKENFYEDQIYEGETVTVPEVSKPSTEFESAETQKPEVANVFPVNDMQQQYRYHKVVISDRYEVVINSNATKIINPEDRKILKVFSDEYRFQLIDGQTVYLTKGVYEPDVKVNPEFRCDSSGKEIEGWENYFTSEVIRYNLNTGKSETLFRTNYFAEVYYADGDYVYYLDIPQEQKGFYNGFEKHGERQLIQYNLRNRTKRVLAEGVSSVSFIENGSDEYIVFFDSENIMKSLNISTGKKYEFERNAALIGYKDGKILYAVMPEGYLEGYLDRGVYTVEIKSCNPDTSDKRLIQEVNYNVRTHLYFDGDVPYKYFLCEPVVNYEESFELYFYNIETDEFLTFDYESYDDFISDNGLWVCYTTDMNGKTTVYKVNDNLECIKLFVLDENVYDLNPEYVTRNGFYYYEDSGVWQFYEFPETIQ